QPALELTVIVYNINLGHNQELLETCSLLKEYAQYVEQVRAYAKEMAFPEAVEQAVEHCIRNGILADFLSENRAEAIAVSIFEYDEEKHIRSERKEWREIGHAEGLEEGHKKGLAEGHKEGLAEGESRALQLIQKLTESGKAEEMTRALSDPAYREQLYREYGLSKK
ncbi:MAG: hypothetical protein HDR17_01275, partial [Lachnospiraceae bacterium]|nr:hypothetical protein [Lachnospiraceae bacterium]